MIPISSSLHLSCAIKHICSWYVTSAAADKNQTKYIKIKPSRSPCLTATVPVFFSPYYVRYSTCHLPSPQPIQVTTKHPSNHSTLICMHQISAVLPCQRKYRITIPYHTIPWKRYICTLFFPIIAQLSLHSRHHFLCPRIDTLSPTPETLLGCSGQGSQSIVPPRRHTAASHIAASIHFAHVATWSYGEVGMKTWTEYWFLKIRYWPVQVQEVLYTIKSCKRLRCTNLLMCSSHFEEHI